MGDRCCKKNVETPKCYASFSGDRQRLAIFFSLWQTNGVIFFLDVKRITFATCVEFFCWWSKDEAFYVMRNGRPMLQKKCWDSKMVCCFLWRKTKACNFLFIMGSDAQNVRAKSLALNSFAGGVRTKNTRTNYVVVNARQQQPRNFFLFRVMGNGRSMWSAERLRKITCVDFFCWWCKDEAFCVMRNGIPTLQKKCSVISF